MELDRLRRRAVDRRVWAVRACFAFAVVLGIATTITSARAHDSGNGVDYYSTLSCDQLWYERNAIYAQYGYCFKTRRAIATFGNVCHPPYGQLPSNLQRVVRHIQHWEEHRGCR